MKDDYAIIIGINDYTPPDSKGLKTLQGAIKDAKEVEAWVSSDTGGKVPASNIKKIISNPNPLRPLQDEIDDAFLDIEKSILNNGKHARRLYFYFAGHGLGTLDSTSDTALCLANWSEYRRQSAISSESYKDNIKQYGYFEEIIFVADCCRNTKINIKPKAPTFSAPTPGSGAGNTKLFVAYATQYQDQSYEIESGGSEMRGAFTTVFIEGLKGAAANNGLIGADDLRDYLTKETPELAKKIGYKQIPDVTHTFINNSTLVNLSAQISRSNVNLIFSSARNNPIELIDGKLEVIQIFNAGATKNFSVLLLKGLYMLRDTITDENYSFSVSPIQTNINVNF